MRLRTGIAKATRAERTDGALFDLAHVQPGPLRTKRTRLRPRLRVAEAPLPGGAGAGGDEHDGRIYRRMPDE